MPLKWKETAKTWREVANFYKSVINELHEELKIAEAARDVLNDDKCYVVVAPFDEDYGSYIFSHPVKISKLTELCKPGCFLPKGDDDATAGCETKSS